MDAAAQWLMDHSTAPLPVGLGSVLSVKFIRPRTAPPGLELGCRVEARRIEVGGIRPGTAEFVEKLNGFVHLVEQRRPRIVIADMIIKRCIKPHG